MRNVVDIFFHLSKYVFVPYFQYGSNLIQYYHIWSLTPSKDYPSQLGCSIIYYIQLCVYTWVLRLSLCFSPRERWIYFYKFCGVILVDINMLIRDHGVVSPEELIFKLSCLVF